MSPTAAGGGLIEVEEVSFAYGEHLVLRECSFAVDEGEFVTLIGPSGCGKTTLLLMLAGILRPGRGEVRVRGRPVEGAGEDRAMVFQQFALLPWRTVLENVMLGLNYRRRGGSREERRRIARRYIELVGLAGAEDKYPHQLSGGMQQRVGIARAFAVDSEILLMDEPFGAIDAQQAELLREELRDLVAREARTIVFITHNLDEALYLSDRILVMGTDPGRMLDQVPVDLPRPREFGGGEGDRGRYRELRSRIWDHLRREVKAVERRGAAGEG